MPDGGTPMRNNGEYAPLSGVVDGKGECLYKLDEGRMLPSLNLPGSTDG